MSIKSRSNYLINGCLKACENNGSNVCLDCFRGDKFIKITQDEVKIKKEIYYAGQESCR